MRAKRLPSLKSYLKAGPAKPLRGAELERRREEFQKMTAALKTDRIRGRAVGRPPTKEDEEPIDESAG